jgi:hypothetical protein
MFGLEKCNLQFDLTQIQADVSALLTFCKIDVLAKLAADARDDKSAQLSVNLNHPIMSSQNVLNLIGNTDKEIAKYVGPLSKGYWPLLKLGVNPASFTIVGDFIKDRYLGSVIEEVKHYHKTMHPNMPPITKIFCAYLGPGAGFTFHKDRQTHYKYHLPVKTNMWSFLYTANEQGINSMNVPADGSVWKLDTSEMHTALNLAPNPDDYRMHIIFNVYK